MPVWLLVLFVIVLVCIIVAIAVLFYYQFRKKNTTTQTGPQGPGGDQGEIGFTGIRGPQGLSLIGPQGIAGESVIANSNVVDMTYFFQSSDIATFRAVPDEKIVGTLVQQIDNAVSLQAKGVECFLRSPGSYNFMIRVQLLRPLQNTSDIVAFIGYVQTQTPNTTLYSTLLTNAIRIDNNTLGLLFTSSSIIWNGTPPAFPSCVCNFSVTYITKS